MSKKKKIKLTKNEGPPRPGTPPRVCRVPSNLVHPIKNKKGKKDDQKTKGKSGAAAEPEPVPGSNPQVEAEPPKPSGPVDPVVLDPEKVELEGDPKPGRKGLLDWDTFFDRHRP